MKFIYSGGKALAYPGLMFIIIGLLVFIFPKFFAFIFAGFVLAIGIFLFTVSIFSKPNQMNNRTGRAEEFSSYEELRD